MADNALQFILKFLVDKNSQTVAKKAVADVSAGPTKQVTLDTDWQQVAETTQQWMRDTGQGLDEASQKLEGMAIVNVRNREYIQASVDAYEQLGIQADKTRRSTEQIAQSTRETAGYARRGTGMMTAMTGV
ncbi:MAG TPA: hypothetical protein VLH56_08970, partial [Dissulfurispiraceae bacterium]|nr:hypothetical protein [Dissulfurispiraceae bacterium]